MNNRKTRPSRWLKVSLGLILAPVIAALLLETPTLLQRDPHFLRYVGYLLELGYVAMLLFAFPAYLLSIRVGWTRLPTFVLLGGLVGLIFYVLIFELGVPLPVSGAVYGAMAEIRYLPLSMIYGVLGFSAFWLLSRPDRL